MPGQDRTGPNGQGPMTGRGLGYCSSYNAPGFANAGFSRGRGLGRGRGFAWRAKSFQQAIQPQVITEKEEKSYLQEELKLLKEEMQEIEKRLKELKD